jgi:hypothetical protein
MLRGWNREEPSKDKVSVGRAASHDDESTNGVVRSPGYRPDELDEDDKRWWDADVEEG